MLFNDPWSLVSERTFGVMYDHTFSKFTNHQIRHEATHKVGCQPGDCIWSLESSSGVCVGKYGLTHSLYHPQRRGKDDGLKIRLGSNPSDGDCEKYSIRQTKLMVPLSHKC